MAKKKPVKKAPAKAGKKPTRGVAKKAPVRVKAAKPKARALHVPDGDLRKAWGADMVRAEIEAGQARNANIAQIVASSAARTLPTDDPMVKRWADRAAGLWPAPTRFQRFRAWLRGLFGA